MSKKSSTAAEIKKRIDQAKKVDPKFSELDLSEVNIEAFTPQTAQLLEKVKSLEILYMTKCGLNTLEGFPKCDFVALDLSRNELSDGSHFQVLASYPKLSQIMANENKIEKIETLLKFESLKNLVQIDFEGNPVTSVEDYRKTLYEKFSTLDILDRKDKDGNEIPEDEEQLGDQDEDDDEEDFDDEDDDEQDYDDESEESDRPKKKGQAQPKKK